MNYNLTQLAPSAYDLLLHGEVVGSMVRTSSYQPYTWTAELLEDVPLARRPAPFTKLEHVFASLEDLCHWLGQQPMKTNNRHGDAWEW